MMHLRSSHVYEGQTAPAQPWLWAEKAAMISDGDIDYMMYELWRIQACTLSVVETRGEW